VESLLQSAERLQDEMVKCRRHVHQHPEVGTELPETSKYVKDKLISYGYEVNEICPYGLVVLAGGAIPGKCIMLRSDMDALPVTELTDEPFKSENGASHSCGHDLHIAMMLAVAKMLKEREKEIKGTVKIVFQPAEEVFKGCQMMIDAGVLENPKVDVAVTQHVNGYTDFALGQVLVPAGGVGLASCDVFQIEVTGKSGHGAWPFQSIDPINAAAHVYLALQEIQAREIAAEDCVVLTEGIFQAGIAPNVIPEKAVIEGTLRTIDESIRAKCLERIRQIASSTAQAFRAQADVTVSGGCPSFMNDPELCTDAERYLKNLLGAENVYRKKPGAIFSSEDFSSVSRKVPTIQISLTVGNKSTNLYPMHNPKVVLKEDPMYIGAASMAEIAIRWLEEHS